jgi:hypothetical protein
MTTRKDQIEHSATNSRNGAHTHTQATARIRGVDLIVISTHDYRWLRRLVEGGDAEKIIHDAPCPVLIVREMSMTSWDSEENDIALSQRNPAPDRP